MQNSRAILENNLPSFHKFKNTHTIQHSNQISKEINPENESTWSGWNVHSSFQLLNESTMIYPCNRTLISKRNREVLTYSTTWVNLNNIILNERIHTVHSSQFTAQPPLKSICKPKSGITPTRSNLTRKIYTKDNLTNPNHCLHYYNHSKSHN